MCNVGKIIHERRMAIGLTLEQVGIAVGVGKSTVRKWECGEIKNMGCDKVMALAKILQIKPIMLVPTDENVVESSHDIVSSEEQALLDAWRAADKRSRDDALRILIEHPVKKDTEPSAI